MAIEDKEPFCARCCTKFCEDTVLTLESWQSKVLGAHHVCTSVICIHFVHKCE